MTAIVGVLCSDGVVIGTDSSTTFGTGFSPTIEQITEKLSIVKNVVIVAGTGQVGMGQRFRHIIETAHNDRVFQGTNHHIDVGKELCRRAVIDFGSTNAQQKQYGALIAFPLGDKVHLCEFAVTDFQPEFKDQHIWYCSMGSGQPITDPFLGLMREVFWESGPPSIQDGVFAATWSLDHVISLNPGGIKEPTRVAVLEKVNGVYQARLLDVADLDEHRENIKAAKQRLREFREEQKPTAAGTPDVPKPIPDATSN
jgi:hypothetical protein